MTAEREIFIKASRSLELLTKANKEFRDYLEPGTPPEAPDYYRARNLLKEGAALLEEAVREAKKLMGPVPPYAPKELEVRRQKALEESRLAVRGDSLDAILAELGADEFLRGVLSAGDMEIYIREHFESQRTGKRKLANFKARLILDRLGVLVSEGRRYQQDAQKKRQGTTAQ
jgi:hypothetical protein